MPNTITGVQHAPLAAPAVGAAHDLRNVLFVVSAHCHRLLQGAGPTDPGFEDLEAIRDATDRGMALARQIMATGAADAAPRPVSINAVVRDILPLLQRLVGDAVAIRTQLADSAWHVQATPTQIEQIVMNLAVNARDAMPAGGRLTVATENRSVAAAGPAGPSHFVVLSVGDSGIGMSPELQARIFDPYFTTRKASGGTGIGLATVRSIAVLGGGQVEVSSAPGEGTIMRVVLPRALDTAGDAAPDVPSEPSLHTPRPAAAGKRVMLIEDEAGVRDLLHRWLNLQGYDVTVAQNGREALALGGPAEPALDLLITDVHLPDMAGDLVARRLRATAPDLPVVYMSGASEALQRAGRMDAPVLTKPFSMNELLVVLERVLHAGRAA